MSNSFTQENEQDQEQKFEQPSAHHPTAPPGESFDVSTTVDPSYVISLIRKLLPSDAKDGELSARSGLVHEEPKNDGRKEESKNLPENAEAEAMESSENYSKPDKLEPTNDDQNQGGSAREEIWEECGCILWDLAASDDHAQFMVQNLILDVLLANLVVSQSLRITEISLGIIGNLACHEISRKQIASTNGLIGVIVEQLFLDDVPCLGEAYRVLTLCLQGGEGIIWAEALKAEHILTRILWVAENALNPQLIEKSVGLLLAVIESKQVAAILLPPMSKLDLSRLLIKLFAFEMGKLKEERIPERYSVLDLILRTIEALSTVDGYSQEMCQNEELLSLVKELIELPDKFEIAGTCISAAVLMANILTDATDLASELSQDMRILQGLFDVLPFASGETEAQNAIWSIISRLLTLVQESEMTPSNFRFLVSILANKSDLIEDELLVCPLGEYNAADGSCAGERDDRLAAITRISNILIRWKSSDDTVKNTPTMDDYYINEEDIDRLLDCCCKYSRQ